MVNRAIFFDFDGVIVDSLGLVHATMRKLIPGFALEEVKRIAEGNTINGAAARTGLPEKEWLQFWTDNYNPSVISQNIFDGVADAVRSLAEDYRLFVVSSTRKEPIEAYLAKHELTPCFKAVLGADLHASKAEKIRTIFAEHEGLPEESVFITDTLGDIREAREAGVDSIGVTWGYHGPELLRKGKPYALVDTPEGLLNAVARYFAILS